MPGGGRLRAWCRRYEHREGLLARWVFECTQVRFFNTKDVKNARRMHEDVDHASVTVSWLI
jgi:hypothetical protein